MEDDFAYLRTMESPIFDMFLDDIPWQASPVRSPLPLSQPTETSAPGLQVAAMEDPAMCFLNDQIPPLQGVDESKISGGVVFQDGFAHTQENPVTPLLDPISDQKETDNHREDFFEIGNQLLLGEKETEGGPGRSLAPSLGPSEGIAFKVFSPVRLSPPTGQPTETSTSAVQTAVMEDPAVCFLKDHLPDIFPQNQENQTLPNSILNQKEVGKNVEVFEFSSQELPPHEPELSSSSVSERLPPQEVVSPRPEEAGGKENAEEEVLVAARVPVISDEVCLWNWQKGKDMSYTLEELSSRGIEGIEGSVRCKSCQSVYDVTLPLNKEKLEEIPSFLQSLGDPWRSAEALRCRDCGEMSAFAIVYRGKGDYVNWFFLFLSKQVSLSMVPQIRRFLLANDIQPPTKGGRPAFLRCFYDSFYKLLLLARE